MEVDEDSDKLIITPLGSGQEVGQSCHALQFKGKKILLDCGIHPGMQGMDALPFFDLMPFDCKDTDLLLVTHFHLDHCGALPYLLEKMAFRGRCFMTHATKAIYRMLIGDYIKVSKYGGSESRMLYTEDDLEKSMEKIEVIDFHEQKEVNGIRFWCYVAGHVLGAAMFMMEIAGVKILYTGDFSRLEDRHLCAAEIPTIRPNVLICESTFGTQIHEPREIRERRFTSLVREIVGRGGQCLIPVFAVGPAQELLLILDEYWEAHPELHNIPIYYASSLAKKCMAVYQTFISGMNQRIQKQIAINNPFIGSAKHILSEPEEVMTLNGQKLPMRLQVAYISFSAHTDYRQTSEFIRELKPPHVVLVHGEKNEMNRLKAAIICEYEDDPNIHIEVHNPGNTQLIELQFRGEKTAKVVGKLAMQPPEDGQILSGVLVRRNFNYHLMHPSDLSAYTELSNSTLSQHLSVFYSGSLSLLEYNLDQIAGDLKRIDAKDFPKDTKLASGQKHVMSVFNGAIVLSYDQPVVILEWTLNPVNDMYADAALAAVLQAESNPIPEKNVPSVPPCASSKADALTLYAESLAKTLRDVCGKDASIKIEGQDVMAPGTSDHMSKKLVHLSVDGKEAMINLETMEVQCTDEVFHHLLNSVTQRLHQTLAPV